MSKTKTSTTTKVKTGKKSSGLLSPLVVCKVCAGNSIIALLFGFFVGFFQRRLGFFFALLERILRALQGVERLSDNFFNHFSAFTHRIRFRVAAVVRECNNSQH